MTTRYVSICIIGMGPRGLSLLERICANARAGGSGAGVRLHLVDPHAPGPGQVWRTSQSRHLLMNTVAGQISVFTDISVDMAGPLEPGPSLYEWAKSLSIVGPGRGYDDQTLAEARDLGSDSYPTRAFYGQYLKWAFRRVTANAPATVSVTVYGTRAVALDDMPGTRPWGERQQSVLLQNGTRLDGLDAVVLAQGHLPAFPSSGELELAAYAAEHELTYLPPANPADVDLSAIRPGGTVLLRGLGLNFFDYVALFTAGRGGSFERTDGRLVYRPSGQEPQLYAGSRRGIPYQARGENEKGPHGRHDPLLLTLERIAALRLAAESGPGLDFRQDVWPLVAKEVETVYYATLLRSRGRDGDAQQFQERYLADPWGAPSETEVLEAFGIAATDRWDWDRIAHPYRGREFADRADFQEWLVRLLHADVSEARSGNVSGPLKAALDVMRDLRNEIRLLVDHGGLYADSHRDDLDGWYTPLNAFLSIGPPTRRAEEMAALMEAGVLCVTGPGLRVGTDPAGAGFTAESPLVPGPPLQASTLVEARLPDITLRRTADPLLRHLLDTGQCRPHRISDRKGDWYETDGLAVTTRPFRLLDAQGRPHPRRFAFGVPTESVHWVTAAGIRPGVNSVTLSDSDAIARAVLGHEGVDSAARTADLSRVAV